MALGGLYSLVPFPRGNPEGLCWEQAAEGLGWGSSGEEVMPKGGRNSAKKAGDVFLIIPAALFGRYSLAVQGKSQVVLWQAGVDLALGRVGDSP